MWCGRIWADEAANYSNPLVGWRVCAVRLHHFMRARVGWPTDWRSVRCTHEPADRDSHVRARVRGWVALEQVG